MIYRVHVKVSKFQLSSFFSHFLRIRFNHSSRQQRVDTTIGTDGGDLDHRLRRGLPYLNRAEREVIVIKAMVAIAKHDAGVS